MTARTRVPQNAAGNTDCTLEKHLYRARTAQQDCGRPLSSSRTGISCSEAGLRSLDGFLSPLLRKGQSIHHVYAGHRDSVMMSESTIYRFIDGGLFSARNIDLLRRVRFAPRRKAKEFKVDRACRQGRTYADFLEFRKSYPDLPVTQIDSLSSSYAGCLQDRHTGAPGRQWQRILQPEGIGMRWGREATHEGLLLRPVGAVPEGRRGTEP